MTKLQGKDSANPSKESSPLLFSVEAVMLSMDGWEVLLQEHAATARLNVPRRDFGVSMTGEEVEELSAAVDIPSVRAYRIAVGRRTREWIQSLSATGLEDELPAPRAGALGQEAGGGG